MKGISGLCFYHILLFQLNIFGIPLHRFDIRLSLHHHFAAISSILLLLSPQDNSIILSPVALLEWWREVHTIVLI